MPEGQRSFDRVHPSMCDPQLQGTKYNTKLSLLRRMRFLSQKQLEDFYTKVISYIRSDSVGIVQQDAPQQPVETPCKRWTDCIWAAMRH